MKRYLIPLFAMALAGCTVGPDYTRPAVELPQQWRYSEGEADAIVNSRWWEQFGDERLVVLIEQALRNNHDVRIAAARVEEFAARVGITRADGLPQLGYFAGAARDRASLETGGLPAGGEREFNSFSASLNAGWELDLWGRIRRASEAARATLLAEEEGRRTVILTLVSTVATSYVELGALDSQLAIARDTRMKRAESLRLFELKFSGGVISELELAQVRSEYEAASIQIPILERQIALLENSLSLLLGADPDTIGRGLPFASLTLPMVPAGIPATLLERRPDIRAAEQRLIAANAQIGVARANYFPTISLTALFGFASRELSSLTSSSANQWHIDAGILGPIFDGGRLAGQSDVAEAIQRQTLESYLKSLRTALREVDDALVSTVKAREIAAAQGRHLAALRDYARLARIRYDEGHVSYIEVLDAERRLADVEQAHVADQLNHIVALISVYKAMGGGWIEQAESLVVTGD